MRGAHLHELILRTLERERPTATLRVLQQLLSEHLGVSDVRLLLANYQLTALHAVHDPDTSTEFDDSPAGTAFVQQVPVLHKRADETIEINLPLSTRGDRMGVLQLAMAIPPEGQLLDELAQLATTVAFAMQAGSRHTDALERAARTQRLTLAAELQWQLLPGRGSRTPECEIAGHLEPAYQVYADLFDWSQDQDHVTLALIDGSDGRRVHILLSTLALTALRNARRAGLPVVDQACLAGQAIYAHHQGAEHVSTLLLQVDLRTSVATAVLAGSPRLFILREGRIYEPQLSEQTPLGMFEDSDYVQQQFLLHTGDRILMVSDGVHHAESPDSHRFGDAGLTQLLADSADQCVQQVARKVIDALYEHRSGAHLDDDAVVLCVDWTGDSGSAATPGPLVNEAAVEVVPVVRHLRAVTSS